MVFILTLKMDTVKMFNFLFLLFCIDAKAKAKPEGNFFNCLIILFHGCLLDS